MNWALMFSGAFLLFSLYAYIRTAGRPREPVGRADIIGASVIIVPMCVLLYLAAWRLS